MRKWVLLPLLIVFFLVFYQLAATRDRTEPLLITWQWLLIFFVLFVALFLFFLRSNVRKALQATPIAATGTLSAEGMARISELESMGFVREGGLLSLNSGLLYETLFREDRSVAASVYEWKGSIRWDLDSLLSDGRLVMTSADPVALHIPDRASLVLQVFPQRPPAGLWERHREALAHFAKQGLTCQPLPDAAGVSRLAQSKLTGVGIVEALGMAFRKKREHAVPIAARDSHR